MPHVPKDSRYTLGVRIDNLFLDILEGGFAAAYADSSAKFTFLKNMSLKMDSLKFFVRILWEIKAFDNAKYILLSERLFEIGKMLGGWIKMAKQNSPALAGEK